MQLIHFSWLIFYTKNNFFRPIILSRLFSCYLFLLYSHEPLYIHICMQKYHNKDERTQFFRKIYLSLYWKCCVWEGVGDWTEQQHIEPPQLFWLPQPFFPVLLGCSTGGLGTQPLLEHGSHSSIFTPTDLNFLSPGLYNNLTSIYFLRVSQFALHSTPRQSRSPPDIFDRNHLLFTPVHFFFWQFGRSQYVTFLFPNYWLDELNTSCSQTYNYLYQAGVRIAWCISQGY